MIITICGAQGAGKSTLIDSVIERMKTEAPNFQVKVMERKTARSVLADWNITLDDVYADEKLMIKFQDELCTRKQQDELECLRNDINTVWIVERSYADLFAYTTVYAGRHNHLSDWLDSYYTNCKNAMGIYESVFYIEGGMFSIQDDGIRPKNNHYGQMVDMFLKRKCKEMLPEVTPFIDIDVKDLAKRTDIVCNYLLRR